MTGDQNDIAGRIKSVLPRWFGPASPLLDALLQGLANASAFVYQLYLYAKLQTRLLTATDGWLDMISADYFGAALPRTANQSDASFRARIIINLFRERGTRKAITKVLTDLTGRAPIIFEPQRPLDTGALGITLGLGVSGGVASLLLPYQAFITAFRPAGTGIPNIPGLGTAPCGLGITAGGAVIPSLSATIGAVTDADNYAAIDSVKPVASTLWTQINS